MHCAIVGYGRIGKRHHQALLSQKNTLQAVCDIDPNTLQALAKDHPDVHLYTSLSALLAGESDLDLISICTPSGLHAAQAIACMEAGKNVLIEKPMALSIADANRIIETQKRTGTLGGVCHQNRLNQSAQTLYSYLKDNRFGKISHASICVRWNRNDAYYRQSGWRGTWAMDGGVLMNQGIHGVDFLISMIDSPVVSVFGQISRSFHNEIETEDLAAAILRFENGATGIIEVTANVYPKNLEETFALFGQKGTVKISGLSLDTIVHWDAEGSPDERLSEKTADIYGNGHPGLYRNMERAAIGQEPVLVSLEEGKKALEVILAVYQSAKEKREVDLPLQSFSAADMKNWDQTDSASLQPEQKTNPKDRNQA